MQALSGFVGSTKRLYHKREGWYFTLAIKDMPRERPSIPDLQGEPRRQYYTSAQASRDNHWVSSGHSGCPVLGNLAFPPHYIGNPLLIPLGGQLPLCAQSLFLPLPTPPLSLGPPMVQAELRSALYLRMTLNCESFCLHLLSAGIAVV